MDNFPWDVTLAVLGIVVPVIAALYEFVLVGRKRLGYRVQMDTTATEEVHSSYAGALQELRRDDGTPLADPSFVLLRVENNGAVHIDTSDYAVLDDDKVGIRVRFPGRRVAGMVVTELSDTFLRHSFGDGSGLSVRDGVIELPKVPMNRGAHYKVLAALERADGAPLPDGARRDAFPDAEIIGGIKGGVGNGGIQETHSRTGTSRQSVALICFLVLVILGQLGLALGDDVPAPLDCASGHLTLTGSTAFAPVLREAAAAYEETCPDARFTIETQGSAAGLRDLDRIGREDAADGAARITFSDGVKTEGYPRLLPRPIAFSLFTLVINEEAGVEDLTLDQVRRIYAGEITNWSEVNGNDVPVRLVSRHSDSGTRKTFEQQVLDGQREPGDNSDDCREVAPGETGVVRCQVDSTGDVLDIVARTPGALGYSAVGEAADAGDGLLLVRIDGQEATLEAADHGAYPFWETEYAYTYGEPDADSLAAGFLRYLTSEVGRDIVRAHGHRPCAELSNPVLCRPT
ncbi:substrate-binding domain-containing protein [Streptomyces specialis]|uniref:substrate-binding domain-containing protein n=1 Tax=Streptomyces specialis TaxID=498367 RepID=UPI00073E4272|nr:substrate-binding domain-containing protein [Streptomyces specialis]